MIKFAIASKHIVLTSNTHPFPQFPVVGVILISNDLIEDIIVFQDASELDIPSLCLQFPCHTFLDYSDLYISPALIDLNVRKEWEDYSQLTSAAVSGGVAVLAIEEGYYNKSSSPEVYYCDVAEVLVVNESTNFSGIPASVCALKGYLYPPGPQLKSITNLQYVISQADETELPLFVDPTLPDPRMLYMASPLRLEPVEERHDTAPNSSSLFAAAYPQGLDKTEGSDSSPSSEFSSPAYSPERLADKKDADEGTTADMEEAQNLSKDEIKTKPSLREIKIFRVNSESDASSQGKDEIPEEIILEVNEAERVRSEEKQQLNIIATIKRKSMSDIYDEIETRIKACSQRIEEICLAEKSTYSHSGSTSFLLVDPIKKSSSLSISPAREQLTESDSSEPGSAQIYGSPANRRNNFRPPPIQIKTEPLKDSARDYCCHLANYPEYWESSGLEKVAECMSPRSRVHFLNISSASALIKVRQIQARFKKVTCEVPAVHLYFTSASVDLGNTRFKNTPPVRGPNNHTLVWELVKMKGVNAISSQHAGIEAKHKLSGNFQQALNGIAAIGCTLQAVWTSLVNSTGSEELLEHFLVRMAKWMSLEPARILGIDDRRGSIERGKSADFMVWQPKERYTVGKEYTYYQTSPFAGEELVGAIKAVYIRGVLAFSRKVNKRGSTDSQIMPVGRKLQGRSVENTLL